MQLGEVKGICEVLFEAKVNSLDNLRRERVSADDSKGPQTDYLGEKSVTNELAVLTPYEVTFRCFSSELAAVLAGFVRVSLPSRPGDPRRSPSSSYCRVNVWPGTVRIGSFMAGSDQLSRRSLADMRPA